MLVADVAVDEDGKRKDYRYVSSSPASLLEPARIARRPEGSTEKKAGWVGSGNFVWPTATERTMTDKSALNSASRQKYGMEALC